MKQINATLQHLLSKHIFELYGLPVSVPELLCPAMGKVPCSLSGLSSHNERSRHRTIRRDRQYHSEMILPSRRRVADTEKNKEGSTPSPDQPYPL